jgi:DNA-binding PadR family transcriptional regulator
LTLTLAVDLGKNETDLMILGSLLMGPAHGYEIMKRVSDVFGALYPRMSHSVLYPRLAQFEKDGLVMGKIEQQLDAPNKKVYQLTEAGFKRVKVLVATPLKLATSSGTYTDDLAVHIVFFSLIAKDVRRKVIEPYYKITISRYEDATKKLAACKSQNVDKFNLDFLEYGVLLLKYTVDLYARLMNED